MFSSLHDLWAYRGFIYASVVREFSMRYRNSLLGATWSILNPLAMMLVYTLIFSHVMQARLPGVQSADAYSIFLMCGLLPWSLFAEIISKGPSLFLEQANLLKKIQFPRLALLIIAISNSLIHFGITFSLFLLYLALTNQFPGVLIVSVLPIFILQLCLAASLCLILAILNVFFRDIAQITNIVLQFSFWLTPIVYAQSMVPAQFQSYLKLNPLGPIFEAYHNIFIGQSGPQWDTLLSPAILCIVLMICSVMLYQKHGADIVDEL